MDPDKNIGRWSWKYAFVKYFARPAFFLFYRKTFISGTENIPADGRLIFAANHQNALMDALTVIMTGNYQPVYLARADIFRNPLIARILRFLKIMPVYRFRDGVDSMGQNEDTFEKTSAVLAEGGCIGIMPEGNHGEKKRLRVLKKGIFRIAFRAEEIYENKLDVKIVPVGIDYSNTVRFYEELFVNYGEPLAVSGYLDLYAQHPQKGINAMKKDLTLSLASLMIDLKDEANYDKDKLLMDIGSPVLCKRFEDRSSRFYNRFIISRAFCQAMDDYFEQKPNQAEELRSISKRLFELLKSYGVTPGSIDKLPVHEIFLSLFRKILCLPVFLTGFLLHIIPLVIIHLVLKKVTDPQFISSFKFVLAVFLIPVNYVFLAVFFFSCLTPACALALLAFVPVTGILAYKCYQFSQKLKEVLHFYRIRKQEKSVANLIYELKSKIIADLEPVFRIAEVKLK